MNDSPLSIEYHVVGLIKSSSCPITQPKMYMCPCLTGSHSPMAPFLAPFMLNEHTKIINQCCSFRGRGNNFKRNSRRLNAEFNSSVIVLSRSLLLPQSSVINGYNGSCQFMGFTHFLHLMNETHEKQVATRSDVKGYPTMLLQSPIHGALHTCVSDPPKQLSRI